MKIGLGIAKASIFCIAAALQPVAAHADDAEANRLMVDAAELLQESTEAPLGERYAILEKALSRLDAIVEDHRGSALAVKLATGQAVGFVELGPLREEVGHYAEVFNMPAALDSLKNEMKEPDEAFGAQAWRVYSALAALDAALPDLGGHPEVDMDDAIDSFQATSWEDRVHTRFEAIQCLTSVADAAVVGRGRAEALRLLDRLRGPQTIIQDGERFERYLLPLRFLPDFRESGRRGISLWDSAMHEAGFELRSGRTATHVWEGLLLRAESMVEEAWPDRSAAALEDMPRLDLSDVAFNAAVVDPDAAIRAAQTYADRVDPQESLDPLFLLVLVGEEGRAVDFLNAVDISSGKELHKMATLSCVLLGFPADDFGDALLHWLARESLQLGMSAPEQHAMFRQLQINAFILSLTKSRE